MKRFTLVTIFALAVLAQACGGKQINYVSVGPHDLEVEELEAERQARQHFEALIALIEQHADSPHAAVAAVEAWAARERDTLAANIDELAAAMGGLDAVESRALEARMADRMGPLWQRYIELQAEMIRQHGAAGQRVFEAVERLMVTGT